MTELLIRHVTAVTMDPERRVMEDAAIALGTRSLILPERV